MRPGGFSERRLQDLRHGAKKGGREMIKSLTAGPVAIPQDHVAPYLVALSRLCLEVSWRPTLLPVFLGILRLAPATITALRRTQWLAA
jgi:hypothetical protein